MLSSPFRSVNDIGLCGQGAEMESSQRTLLVMKQWKWYSAQNKTTWRLLPKWSSHCGVNKEALENDGHIIKAQHKMDAKSNNWGEGGGDQPTSNILPQTDTQQWKGNNQRGFTWYVQTVE